MVNISPQVIEFFVKIFMGYHTAQDQSPRGIILRRINLPGVSYSAESISLGYHTALSQSPRGMRPQGVMFWRIYN